MNQDNDNEFWSKLGDTLKPRLSEARWTAQRARILSRLAPEVSGRLRSWAAAAALACLAGLWFLLPSVVKEETKVVGRTQAPVAAAAAWDARVTMVQGQVTVFSKGSDEGVPAVVGMPLDEGDLVRTGADGRAELALSADSVIDLGPVSAITLMNLKPQQTLLNLDLGILVAKLRWDKALGRRMDVQTPTVVAAVRGTEFGVTVQEGGDTSVGVFDEGRVAVQTKDAPAIEETMLLPHQEVHVPSGAQAQTETKEGRTYLAVGELSKLKPYQETIERVRERPEALGREWKELEKPERELVRGRMIQEHRGRMQALPPEERQSLREQLRRPGQGEQGGMRLPGGPGMGQTPGQQAGPRQGGPEQQPDSLRENRPAREGDRRGRQSGDGAPSGPDHGSGGQPEGGDSGSPSGGETGAPGMRHREADSQGRGDDAARPGQEKQPGQHQQERKGQQPQPGDGQRPQDGGIQERGQGPGQREPGEPKAGGGMQQGGSPGGESRGRGRGRPGGGGGMRQPGGQDRSQGGQNRPQGGQHRRPGGRGGGRRN